MHKKSCFQKIFLKTACATKIIFINYLNIFIKKVIIEALTKSINKLPTIGRIKKARGAGPNLCAKAFILAMALGVAPIPKPHRPADITAAS